LRKVYSCIDIGSHSLKMIVAEEINNKFVILSRTILKTKGIKKGIIVSIEDVYQVLKQAFINVESELGIKVDNVLCLVPSDNREIEIVTGRLKLEENKEIDEQVISKVIQNAGSGKVEEDKIAVNITPIFYKLDDKDNISNVLGMTGTELKVKAVLTKIPKANISPIFDIMKKLNKNIIDISLNIIGDYYIAKDNDLDRSTTAVINIGYERVEVGIFNKGILIKNENIDTGSIYVDKDISYMYNVERKKARFLKETFTVSNTRYADINDVTVIENRDGNNIQINQLEISEITEARLRELLKLAKKQINILTNKEIRYIIITGGISEIAGFQYLVENIFGYNASTLVIKEMGVRSNLYSSCLGSIKKFSDKLKEKNKDYSMISDSSLDIMTKKYRKSTSENGKVNILNIFTGNNKED